MILESLDFDPQAPWWCVEGGAQQIAYRMKDSIKHQENIHFNKTVKALSYVDESCTQIKLTLQGQEEKDAQVYDSVFNSVTLGAMQHMQLEGLNLNWGTKQAIRSLGYGASCKVGVRFKTLWWIKKFGINQGGIAKTDLPIRCCVYPSYNIHDDEDAPGVLLVSYTWSQEAERIGSLINRNSPAGEDDLKEVLFHDLARLHCRPEDDYQQLYTDIKNDYLDHYAKNWYDDKTTVGAFAYFGPGQFKGMYPWITRNTGRHIIIGEAASAHHAWVVGSLESAVRGVYNFLNMASQTGDVFAQAAFDAYNLPSVDGKNPEIPGPFGPLPAEYDRTDDIAMNKAQRQMADKIATTASPVGELARWQMEIEKIRLRQGADQVDAERISEDKIKRLVGVPPPTPPGDD